MSLQLTWKQVWTPILGLLGALLVALVIAIYVMQAPIDDLRALIIFLLASSIPSLSIGYLVFILGRKRLHSIRHKTLLAYSLGVVIAIINIYVTSQLMFVSQHDFLLLGLLLVFAGILSASFGYLLAASVTQSLLQLQHKAHRLATGDFSARVDLDETDELAAVAKAFNMMADELQKSFARQQELEQARRNLVAAISHDLRTPLTSIRAMVEALADGVITDPATINRYYETIRLQTENLSALIEDLSELSRLDVDPVKLQLEPVNLNDLLSDVLESMQAQVRRKEITLTGTFHEGLPLVKADVTKIQRVLYNLVQNAIRHTPPGGTITLATTTGPEEVRVDVTDSGEGITPADLPHIFDQFYRGEKSRSRETGGAGLGLAIARHIIEAHQGRIWAESQVNQGTRLSFVLPLA